VLTRQDMSEHVVEMSRHIPEKWANTSKYERTCP